MVEWKPLLGVIPPLSEADWLHSFKKYQAFPEYQKMNFGMSLAEYKLIFYFEYFHRLLGRLIGVIFFIPFVYFLLKKQISKSLLPKLVLMFVLGGLQGLLGWYMVKSGLISEPRVSQYRLTAHLGLAIIIYAYMLWLAFDLWFKPTAFKNNGDSRQLHFYSALLTELIFVLMLSGGLVAGTRAGFAYNTFPLMAGTFIPDGIFAMAPWWQNIFENIITIQFNHRMLAYAVALLVVSLCIGVFRSSKDRSIRIIASALLAALVLQLALGITTLLLVVPVLWASLHQAGAVVLFTASLLLSHQLRPVT